MSQPQQIGERSGLVAGPWRLGGAGLAAAVALWLVIDKAYPFWSDHTGEVTGRPPDVALMSLVPIVHYQNVVALSALIGAGLGLVMALVEGVSRRSISFVISGSLSGAVLGGAIGAAAGCAAQRVESFRFDVLIDLARAMTVQASFLGIVGLGVGLGVTLPARKLRLLFVGATGGAVGGVLASLLYTPLAAIVFAMADTDGLVPSGILSRLVWLSMPALAIGLVLGGVGRAPRVVAPSQDTQVVPSATGDERNTTDAVSNH